MATLVISILGVELLLYLPSFNHYFSLNRQVTFLLDILPGMMKFHWIVTLYVLYAI
jgi:hypothetical protein